MGTALSRMSGFFRDIAMAISFGSCPEIAAFFVAYRLANLFRRLFEGSLGAAFIPHFIEAKERGPYFYRDVFYSMMVLLACIVFIFELLFWGLVQLLSPDWAEVLKLSMRMLPGIFFVSLYALNSSLMQCYQKYFISAVAPVAFNCIWICSVVFIEDVQILALTITLAFAAQWLVTSFEGSRLLSLKQWLKPHLFSGDFKRFIQPMLLGIIGISAVQLNSALDPIFARIADLKGPVYLWYAIRIQQLPLALFGIALTGALLPPLTRVKEKKKREELLQDVLAHGVNLMLIFTFGIFALSKTGVNLFFGHGGFSSLDVCETSRCLYGYGAGLVPNILVLILATDCYSQKEYRLPMFGSLISVAINIFLNCFFIFGLKLSSESVAWATSLSSLFNCFILIRRLVTPFFWLQLSKMTSACLISFLLVKLLDVSSLSRQFPEQLLHFFTLTFVYFLGVFLLAWKWGLKKLVKQVVELK